MRLVWLVLWLVATGVWAQLPAADNRAMDAREAAHAFRKSGFEASPYLLSQWVGKTRHEWVQQVMDGLTMTPGIEAPEWTEHSVRHWGFREWPNQRRRAFADTRRDEVEALRAWWMVQMVATPSPMSERMVMFWHNTFVVSFDGLKNRSDALWAHDVTIRQHGLGNYRDLLAAMIRDPALLIYLDNTSNVVKHPNENLARELFEIYTLGDTHYSEIDIREAARALTGWHVAQFGPLRFSINEPKADSGQKTIFGQTGHFDGDDLAGLILSQPASAEHVVSRLWQEFISNSDPDPEFVKVLSELFVAESFEIRPVLKAMLNSTYFWDAEYAGTRVKSPVELVVGATRGAQRPWLTPAQSADSLRKMGQHLFAPPNVSGWGYGEYWLDPALIVERERALGRMGLSDMAARPAMTDMPAMAPREPSSALPGDAKTLVTKEMVSIYFTPAKGGRELGLSVMFDGLAFAGRTWDYFGVAFHQQVDGQYRMTLTRDQCRPDCLQAWPVDLARKRVTNKARFYPEPTRADERTFWILDPPDQALVAALMGVFPLALERVLASKRHTTPAQVEAWRSRMDGLKVLSETGSWNGGRTYNLIEYGVDWPATTPPMRTNPMRSFERYGGADESTANLQSWSRDSGLGPDLEQWMVSVDVGLPIRSFADWLRNPAFNVQ